MKLDHHPKAPPGLAPGRRGEQLHHLILKHEVGILNHRRMLWGMKDEWKEML